PARRRHVAQVLAAGVGAARGRGVLRPCRPGDSQVAAAAAGRPDVRLRDELSQVRRGRARRAGGRVADARAPHRATEADRRDGRARARVPEPERVPALAAARADGGWDSAVHADRRGALRAGRGRVAGRAGGKDPLLERLQVARRLVGRAASVLTTRLRLILGAVLGVLVGCYYAWSSSLWNASTWWDVAWISLVLVPAVFSFVYLALPLRTWRWA